MYLSSDATCSRTRRRPTTTTTLVTIRFGLRLYGVAVAYYRLLLKLFPARRSRLLSYLGTVYERAGKHAEALECYREARDLQPERASSYFDVAAACERVDLTTEAIANYKRFIDLDSIHGDLARIAESRISALSTRPNG